MNNAMQHPAPLTLILIRRSDPYPVDPPFGVVVFEDVIRQIECGEFVPRGVRFINDRMHPRWLANLVARIKATYARNRTNPTRHRAGVLTLTY